MKTILSLLLIFSPALSFGSDLSTALGMISRGIDENAQVTYQPTYYNAAAAMPSQIEQMEQQMLYRQYLIQQIQLIEQARRDRANQPLFSK